MNLLDELADIAADLRAYVETQRLTGGLAFPVEEVRPTDLGPMPATPRPTSRSEKASRVSARPPSTVPEQPTKTEKATGAPAPSTGPRSLGRWADFENQRSKAGSEDSALAGGLGSARSLESVREILGDCRRCGLCEERSRIVFGAGSPSADLMVVGEAPGFHEDQQGEPFVGKAGQMLDKMFENVLGLRREQVYISNVVKCRPPRNRNPEPDEIARCRPFLFNQIRLVQPKVLLVLGSVACRAVLDTDRGVSRIRGQWQTVDLPGGAVRAMPTFHPAYLLRKPEDKRLVFEDLKRLREVLVSDEG